MAHAKDVPAEAELGAVLGHESGPLPPYEELFNSGRGFTRIDEAETFVRETGDISAAQQAVAHEVEDLLRNYFRIEGSALKLANKIAS